MTPSFSPHLVNDPFGDPGLYIEVRWSRRALLFDLGDTASLSPTSLLRVQDIFLSHTHMDHFIGFDRLIRVALGRGKRLRFFGPPGLIANIEGKLRGYTWNLVDGYPLSLEVREFHPDRIALAEFHAKDGFLCHHLPEIPADHSGVFPVLQEPALSIRAGALNHRIPSLAFALEEPFHININKVRLHQAGLPVGSWLKDVKQCIWEGRPDSHVLHASLYMEHRQETRTFTLGELKERFVTISRGQKIAYVVDCRYDTENERKIIDLCRDADTLFCEAPFLEQDREKAKSRYHLTANQAGVLGAQANVQQLVVFHFSPRYTGQGDLIRQEAHEAFTSTNQERHGTAV
ncbi:MAG: ribonuclease Z [Nitrospirales bacterium]